MVIQRSLGRLALGMAAAAGIFAQTSAPPTLLEDGRRLVAQLKLEPTADAVLFQTTGLDRSNQLMQAVVAAGLDGNATLDDWANLHRAVAGQAELAIQRGDLVGAITHLSYQEAYYNMLESDYNAALKTAMQLLEMEKNLPPVFVGRAYKTVGDDLRRLGRASEALEAYRERRRCLVR
jgi:tetratricopeptide (TPR) repeat protein